MDRHNKSMSVKNILPSLSWEEVGVVVAWLYADKHVDGESVD